MVVPSKSTNPIFKVLKYLMKMKQYKHNKIMRIVYNNYGYLESFGNIQTFRYSLFAERPGLRGGQKLINPQTIQLLMATFYLPPPSVVSAKRSLSLGEQSIEHQNYYTKIIKNEIKTTMTVSCDHILTESIFNIVMDMNIFIKQLS